MNEVFIKAGANLKGYLKKYLSDITVSDVAEDSFMGYSLENISPDSLGFASNDFFFKKGKLDAEKSHHGIYLGSTIESANIALQISSNVTIDPSPYGFQGILDEAKSPSTFLGIIGNEKTYEETTGGILFCDNLEEEESISGLLLLRTQAPSLSEYSHEELLAFIEEDEELKEMLIEKFQEVYKVISRLYYSVFHSYQFSYVSSPHFCRKHEYIDLRTTLKDDNNFVPTAFLTKLFYYADFSTKSIFYGKFRKFHRCLN